MRQQLGEVWVVRELSGWRVERCSESFLEMTGFTREEISESYQDCFLQLFLASDMPAAEEFFMSEGSDMALWPWIFTMKCAGNGGTMPVLLQLAAAADCDTLQLRIYDASFLDEQTKKMGRRILPLAESFPSGFCQVLMDDGFTIIWHNDYFLEMLGYTQEQLVKELKSKAAAYIHTDDIAPIREMLRKAIEQGQRAFTTEVRVSRRDGEVRNLLVSMSFTDEMVNGVPVLYSFGIDITSQKKQQELEQDAERLRFVMEQTSSYIVEYLVRERTLMASKGLEKYFGLSGNVEHVPEALIDTGSVIEEFAQTLRQVFWQIEQGEERAEGIVGLRCRDGQESPVWFHIKMISIYDERGKPGRALLLAEDITRHYNTELRYREEENRRVAMTYDMNFSGQFDLNTDKILSVDESKFPFFDFSRSDSGRELIRENAAYIIHEDDRGEYLRKLSTEFLLEQYRKGVPEMTVDFRVIKQDGGYGWSRVLAHIIKEPVHGHICTYMYTKDIEEEKNKELELRRHAEQDTLTGLLNRYTVELYCNECLKEHAGAFSVMYMMDLDNFKYLNDTWGHFRGDEMLRQAAQNLKNLFGDKAVLGRLGGDELVALETDCPSVEAAMDMAGKICNTMQSLEAAQAVVTVSVGLAFAPKDGRTFTELYHSADEALYQAKRSGKNCYAIYEKNKQEEEGGAEKLPVSREWLLEESSDIVYVSDFYNYDLLYMNQGARELFGVKENEYIGRKCYKILQHKDRPCEFCTNYMLCREHFHCWEFRNKILGRSLWLRDRIVDWYGVTARIEFATDVSEIDKRNQILTEQVEIDQVIIDCLRIISRTKSLEEAIKQVLQRLLEFYGADRTYALSYAAGENRLKPYLERDKEGVRSFQNILGEEGMEPEVHLRECLETHQNYKLDGAVEHNGAEGSYHDAIYDAGISCQRGVPFYLNGEPYGLLGLDNPTNFRNEVTVLETLGYFISEELSRSRLSAKLENLGYHDSLTGLLNRNQYVEYMEEVRHGHIGSMGVAVADLNALKDINELRGHSHGDAVVKRAAELLTDSFPTARIFRLSGDEFVVYRENLDKESFVNQVRMARAGAPGLQAYGIAIGYAWTDQDIDCSKLTMQATDVMMIQKREYYQNRTQEHGRGKHNHEQLQDLIDHIKRGCFKIYLQPKAGCESFCLNGAEALVRYETAETGVIVPDRFIPLLEKDHMVQYVDLFILEEVCKLLARWQAEGRALFTISLNFSRQTVLEPEICDIMLALTSKYQVPKECIEVEITESLGDYESSTVAEIGESMKQAGFRLALDDFGSHYTNMAMLSTVSVNVLKLDRGMIQNVMSSRANQLVLKSVLSLCRDLGISSIAEGVETEEQLQLLRSYHCDSIQGYLFGRPISVEEFEEIYIHGK